MTELIKRNPLYFAFFFPALVDGVITLVGQGSQYWEAGRKVNEASPAYYFLSASPWLFVGGAVIWYLFWYWAFKRLKEPMKLWLMFTFIAGHAWGSTSWMAKLIRDTGWMSGQIKIIGAWSLFVVYFALIGFSATCCLRVYLKRK